MLKTLLKHEWKDTWILGTACNAVSLLLSVIGAVIIMTWDFADIKEMTEGQTALIAAGVTGYIMIYVFSVIAVVLVMRYYFFIRYYKNLFTDQGYLMHTLPVKSSDLINSKLIIAGFWQYATGAVMAVSIFILITAYAGTMGKISPSDIADSFSSVVEEWDELAKSIPLMIAAICVALLTPIMELLIMYMAVGIGQMTKKNRLLISILVLVGINIAKRYLTSFVSLPMQLMYIGTEMPKLETINILSFVAVVIMIGVIVGLYFLDKYFLEKKLNLE